MSDVTISGIPFDFAEELPKPEDVEHALQRERARQLRRTERGEDVDGRPFAPYSPEYGRRKAAWKAGLGPRPGTKITKRAKRSKIPFVGTARVDLTLTGQMLLAVELRQVESRSRDTIEGRIGVYGPGDAAKADGIMGDQRRKGMPMRRFLGTRDLDVDRIGRDIAENIDQRRGR